MGASSSTIKDTILVTFNKVDVGKKGYLVRAARPRRVARVSSPLDSL